MTVLDPMDIDYLLTATRSARKSLDLDAPIDLGDIRDCLRIALQAANGSNSQAWRWLVISDPELRKELAGLYREAYLLRVGGQLVADLMPAGYRAQGEQALLFEIVAWDVNCPQHIPQKLDAADVAAALAQRDTRIAELEAELAFIKARLGETP